MNLDLPNQLEIEIRRRAFFEASHRYWIDDWPAEENLRRFGRCASPYGHGHNYVVDVVVAGPQDPRSSMVLNLRDLNAALAQVVGELDHRFLNEDVPYFRSDHLPSVEALATYIRRSVDDIVRAHPQWSALCVREAEVSEGYATSFESISGAARASDGGPDCSGPRGRSRWERGRLARSGFRARAGETPALPGCVSSNDSASNPPEHLSLMAKDEAPMSDQLNESVSLTRTYTFSAAHRLHEPALSDDLNRELFGKCNNPHGHGHTYQLEVTVGGSPDHVTGMVVDLVALDRAVEEQVLSRVDHRHLNHEVPPFDRVNPTSENVVRVIWEWLEPACPACLESLTLHETFRSGFTVRRRG